MGGMEYSAAHAVTKVSVEVLDWILCTISLRLFL